MKSSVFGDFDLQQFPNLRDFELSMVAQDQTAESAVREAQATQSDGSVPETQKVSLRIKAVLIAAVRIFRCGSASCW